MAYYFNKKNHIFAISILLLVGCKEETIAPIQPTPNYTLQKIESANRAFNFQYNDNGKIKSLTLIDKNSSLSTNYQYLYNTTNTLKQVSINDVKYIIEYESPNSFTVITSRLPEEKLFKDNFTLDNNKITQHTHYTWESNQWKPEGKYDYSYYADGNLHRIELFSTTWNNQWYLYGSYLFKSYDTLKNNLATIDFITSFMNFQLPFVIEYFKNTFKNNPIGIQSFDANGNLLLNYSYEYQYSDGLRVKRIQSDFFETQLISTDTLNYYYNP